MTGYIRQSIADIIPGEDVRAEPLNAEFNRLQVAFGTTGHTHDGAPGNGPPINLGNSVTGILGAANGGTGGKNNITAVSAPTVNDDSTQGYVPGSIWINTATNNAYIMVNNQAGMAIWRLIQSPTGSFLQPANNLSDVSNLATARQNLGLVVGTDVQAYSNALNGLINSTGINRIPYSGGTNSYTYFTSTAFSRGLMANGSAATYKAGLGLENVDNTADVDKPISTATQNAINAITKTSLGLGNVDNTSDANKPVSGPQQAALDLKLNISAKATGSLLRGFTDDTNYITSKAVSDANAFVSGLPTNLANGFNYTQTLTSNVTIAAPTNAKEGISGVIRLVQDGTGNRTATWNTFWNFGADGPPTLSTGASNVDYVFYVVLPGAASAICSFKAGQ